MSVRLRPGLRRQGLPPLLRCDLGVEGALERVEHFCVNHAGEFVKTRTCRSSYSIPAKLSLAVAAHVVVDGVGSATVGT